MFSFIKGTLIAKSPTLAIVEAGGIGYEIFIPVLTYDKLPDLGKEITLFVHLNVSDTEGFRLFGFISEEEKLLFKKLITVSKIGPKTAISILSVLSAKDLSNAILSNDVSLIKTVPGIGKKTAERLVVELKDKVKPSAEYTLPANTSLTNQNLFIEAESALITLGYKLSEIKKIFNMIAKTDYPQTVEELIKLSIKYLYNKRKK